MPIRPFDLQNQPEIPDELNEILVNSGLAPDNRKLSKEDTRSVFNAAGASIDEVAKQVSNVMKNGESDAGRLKAAELALKVHGVLQELDEKSIPNITINISGSENKTLINLVLPTV